MERIVRKLEPLDQQSYEVPLQFSQYLKIPNIILLGDPGSGKTYTFLVAAGEEKAEFLSVRQFLATRGRGCEGKTLYLDGLDEFRSRVDDKNAIIEVIRLLDQLERPRLRLSCRIADWLGETDLSLFRSYFRESAYVVLNLEPLNDDEIQSILRARGIEKPREFVREARGRGIEGLLANPQTLIMLSEVVGGGTWPTTKLELYEKSVKILLSEHNRARMGPGLGQYSPEELIAPAGAACTSLLISNVPGIRLLEGYWRSEFPTYREVPFDDLGMVQACLMRRAFSVVEAEQEAVSYIHRTIAEFIAARWLSEQIRKGLPIRRVQSLIGIEGHPAPELRGLHAWLATLLPEHAGILIKTDPYGILGYGDPAELSLSDRKLLLSSLESLSKTDPWFRRGNWSDTPLGALSGPDMVESFQRILSDLNSSFHLRSVVLDAIINGPSLPQLRPILLEILQNNEAPYRERSDAMEALLRVIPDGEIAVAKIFRSTLSGDPASARLRAEILSHIYTTQFGPSDVLSVFKDMINDPDENRIGGLFNLAYSLPTETLPAILEELCNLNGEDSNRIRRHKFEVESAFSHMFARVLKSELPKRPEQIWHWLKGMHRFAYREYSGSGKDDIRVWLSEHSPEVLSMFRIAFSELDIEKSKWTFLYDFQRISMLSLPNEDLGNYAFKILRSKDTLTEKDCFLYQVLGQLVFQSDPPSRELFEEFFELADVRKELGKIREDLCQWVIPDWQREHNLMMLEHKNKRQRKQEKNRAILEETKESIRSGRHLPNLGFLARIYFRDFWDTASDKELTPIERLRAEIGEDLIVIALEGFSAVIRRDDLPSPNDVAILHTKDRLHPWWYAILAGIDEEWQKGSMLNRFSDELLKSALAISIEYPTYEQEENVNRQTVRQWKERLFVERPDLVQSVYEDMARVELKAKRKYITVISDLFYKKETEPWNSKLALKLLFDFPNTSPSHLRDMTLAAIFDPECHRELTGLAKSTINAPGRVKGEQRAIWLAIGFLLDPGTFRAKLIKYADTRDQAIWIIIDIVKLTRKRESDNLIKLTIEQLEVLIKLVGAKFKNCSRPIGEVTVGDKNPWDVSEFVTSLINAASAIPEPTASHALRLLLKNEALESYHDYLKHALANQANIRRQAEYSQPSWQETTEALKGGKPANIADLHALLLDHIETLKVRIRLSNTDIYKAFWRCNSRGAVELPEIEDICRDRLIDLLRPYLAPLGIRIEPEGHMAADKRADIVILPPPGQKLPLELKRDTHGDLWEACINQLERMYTRDPEAAGYGIYGVFWFGDKRSGRMPAPPGEIRPPESSMDLEKALKSLIPSDRRHCLEAIVFDVTPPS